jgi:hypothetical protein
MPGSPQFYLKRDDREEGPLTIAQINRMKQRGGLAVDTLCRRSEDADYRRLDEVLPHLKEHAPMDPVAKAKLKQDLIENEVRILTQTGFGSGALFWAPLGIGFMGAAIAVYCGFALLVKYRRPIGLAAILLGLLGFWARMARRT